MKPYSDRNGKTECNSRAPWWRAVVASLLLVASAVLYTSALDARAGDIIWEGDDQSVVLAPQDEASAPPNDHPATLERQDVEEMLSGLRFRQADQDADAPPVAVFNKEQVQVLGDALTRGLSRAEPSQDVTFSVVGAHRLAPGAFAVRNRLTAGRAFFRDGKLNVIFGEIQSPYRKKNIYGRLEEDFYPRKFGSRTAPEAQEALLVASAGASLRAESSGDREDWIVFDDSPDSAAASPAPPLSQADAPPKNEAEASERRPIPAVTAVPEPTRAPRSVTETSPDVTPDIEQRLETLKRLRDKDLISEQVYREKVDEILDEI